MEPQIGHAFCIRNGGFESCTEQPPSSAEYSVVLLSFAQAQTAGEKLPLPCALLTQLEQNKTVKFESHNGFDLLCLRPLDFSQPGSAIRPLAVVVQKDSMLVLSHTPDRLLPVLSQFTDAAEGRASLEGFVRYLLSRLFEGDTLYIERLEAEVSVLEDQLITGKKKDCVREIVQLRRRLMVLKQCYEPLLDVFDAIEENENGLIGKPLMQQLKLFSTHIDRTYRSILNLRDYITQVREAYQAQVDINLNGMMKFFTVITTLFFPLTLIAGWYGMNVQMPEFGWPFGYLFVIVLSIVVVTASILYFKKNKWF